MKKPYYGGQAVMEGVVMQGPEGKAIACRKSNGEIVYKITEKPSLKKKIPDIKQTYNSRFHLISRVDDQWYQGYHLVSSTN